MIRYLRIDIFYLIMKKKSCRCRGAVIHRGRFREWHARRTRRRSAGRSFHRTRRPAATVGDGAAFRRRHAAASARLRCGRAYADSTARAAAWRRTGRPARRIPPRQDSAATQRRPLCTRRSASIAWRARTTRGVKLCVPSYSTQRGCGGGGGPIGGRPGGGGGGPTGGRPGGGGKCGRCEQGRNGNGYRNRSMGSPLFKKCRITPQYQHMPQNANGAALFRTRWFS